jgi:DNA-binding LacI/PurR family transcriptional regulator
MNLVRVQPLRYQAARDAILASISSGELRAGDRLPGERVLAERFGMNTRTVRRALGELVEEGILYKQPRAGCFVRRIRPRAVLPQVIVALPVHLRDVGTWDPHAGEEIGGRPGGILRSDGTHPLLGLLSANMARVLDQRNYAISTLFYHYSRFWMDIGAPAVEWGARGMILWSGSRVAPAEMRRLLDAGVQVVVLDAPEPLAAMGLPTVGVDYRAAAGQLVNRLVQLGHRRIAVASYERTGRVDPILSALEEVRRRKGANGLEVVSMEIANAPTGMGYDCLERIFAHPRPTAVVTPDEFTAHEVFRRCRRHEVRIPEQLSVAALSNITPWAFGVSLTAADSARTWGRAVREAADQLKQMLDGQTPRPAPRQLEAKMEWGQSIDRPQDRGDGPDPAVLQSSLLSEGHHV